MARNGKTNLPSVTIFAFVTRNEGLTTEEFQRYWVDTHGPLVGEFLSDMGVLSYRQFHIDPAANPLGYDGIVQLELPTMETWAKISADKYYKEVIVQDEMRFFQSSKIVMSTGRNYSVVEGGKYVLSKP